MTIQPALADIDFTDLDNFAHGFPHHLFAIHRAKDPVFWHEPTQHTPDGEGFWSVATYAETMQVLRAPEIFSSVTGGDRAFGGTLLQDLPIAGQVLNMMDDPRHAHIRRLVSSGLTPRMMGRVEDDLRSRVAGLIDKIEPGVPFDFVPEIAAELPMQMICILLGIPESDRHWLFEMVEPSFDFRGSRTAAIHRLSAEDAGSQLYAYGSELLARKRTEPADDMLSIVASATIDDPEAPGLSDAELYLFFLLLFSAGAETTRNAIAGGLLALVQRPHQLLKLRDNLKLVTSAAEEMVRWTSPSPSKRRTVTSATTLGGKQLQAGQKVVVWEGSANRDPAVFDQPDHFDITRQPNPHLGFGHGVHYCLGAHLARLELRTLFQELLPRMDTLDVVKPVEWTRSNRHTGIRHLTVEFGHPNTKGHP